VPSTSILTNGGVYYFIRFVQQPNARLVRSSEVSMSISVHSSVDDIRQSIEPIISRIVGILTAQKRWVEEFITTTQNKYPKLQALA
jgi:hypothetical protein